MSRARPVYTIEQLLALQHSPLVKKPDDLPRIEQWIEAQTDPKERRPRLQGGVPTGKGEENENPGRRPNLFEARQRQGNSQSGEDLYLGPKTPFAAAARLSNRRGGLEEKGAGDEPRDKYDRFGGKDRPRRDVHNDKDARDKDYDGFRNRFSRLNGFADEDESRGKRGGDYHDRGKEGRDGGVSLDGPTSRRNGPTRKFDQPWYRDANKAENKNDREIEDASEGRAWRNNEWRNERWNNRDRDNVEPDPQWMAEPTSGGSGEPTQDDFQKWKEKMKASNDPKPPATEEPDEDVELQANTVTPEKPPISAAPEGPFFGIWGEQKREMSNPDNNPPTPKATKPTKASRFATMFKDATPAVQEPELPQEPAPSAKEPPKKEDQEGFERMMAMLRMGGQGSSSQGPPQPQLFGRPPSGQFSSDVGRGTDASPMHERSNFNDDAASRGLFTSPNQPPNSQQELRTAVQGQSRPQRPELLGRDSSFLLKLMQQPPPSFGEGKIYGQGYDRREPDERSAYVGGFSHGQPQESRSREPPPGLFVNEGAFANNQNVDSQFRSDGLMRPQGQMAMHQQGDRFGGPLPPHNPVDAGNMAQGPMFDQFPPNNNHRPLNAQPPGHDNIPPPPGFSASRGQAPPGFYPFGGGNQPGPQPPPPQQHPQMQQHKQHHAQQYNNNGAPQNMRGPVQSPQYQLPPGFPNNPPSAGPNQGLPPGFPPMGNMPPNRGQHNVRSVGPQGNEPYGEAARRGPPPPPPQSMQSQWPPQFVKQQMGGGGGYQGM